MDLEYLQKNFVYKSDDKQNSWRILDKNDLVGDCEDYALTALYILSGESMTRFFLALIFGTAKIKYGKITNGMGHAVLKYKGKYTDNIQRKWVQENHLDARTYDLSGNSYLWFITLYNLARDRS